MALLFDSVVVPEVAVQNSELRYPVRRIYCVGQNYRDHVEEMGGDPKLSPPVFFSKPADAVLPSGSCIAYPSATANLHYEAELVVALKSGGSELDVHHALECIYGYAVGIDFTRRDLQAEAKEKGRPWDTAKGFDASAPLSSIKQAEGREPADARIWLKVNGELRQDAKLSDMIWSVPEILAQLSRYFALRAGDLIFTGTPAGVSSVAPGDRIQGGIEGVGEVAVELISGAGI